MNSDEDIRLPADMLPGLQNAGESGLEILIRNRKADGWFGFGRSTVVARFGVLSLW